MSWPGKPAGAPPPPGAAPTDSIAARVIERRRIAKEAAKEELTTGMDAIADPDVADAVADAVVAAEEVESQAWESVGMMEEGGKRRKRRTRGGAKTTDAVKEVVSGILASGPGIAGAVDTALATAIRATPTALKVGTAAAGVATVLNHPTLFGNLAQLSAQVLKTAADTGITATWGQWGEAILGVGRAIGVVAGTVATQAAQGPVAPVAIATAIMAWRAGREEGAAKNDIAALIRKDAAAVASAVAQGVTSQLQSFETGREIGTREMFASQLKELGEIAKVAAAKAKSGASGEGAAATSSAFGSNIAPAAQPAPASAFRGPYALPPGPALVRGSDTATRIPDVARNLGSPAASSGVPAARKGPTSGPMKTDRGTRRLKAARSPEAVRPLGEDGRSTKPFETGDVRVGDADPRLAAALTGLTRSRSLGGRKTAKKAKKSKRRVTRRRKPFPSAKMPVFAY
jgi:hypothetical protein